MVVPTAMSSVRRTLGAAALILAITSAPASAVAATTERVSVDSAERQADVFVAAPGVSHGSFAPSLSADGAIVAFGSNASDLVAGDTNGAFDVFVRDRRAGTTERASVGPAGVEADGGSGDPDVSGDGRFVAFSSDADNLVAGDVNGNVDVFVRDRVAGTTELVSVGPGGARIAADSFEAGISDDGRFVTWRTSEPAGPDPVVVRDRRDGTTVLASVPPPGGPTGDAFSPAISGDGRFVVFDAFTGRDTQSVLLLRDVAGATTESLGVDPGAAAVSRDARFVTFTEGLDVDRVAVFVLDRVTGVRQWIAPGVVPDLSADGRFVAFAEPASSDVIGPGPQDVLVRDRATGFTDVASVTSTDGPAGDSSWAPAISADGRVVAFESYATNLVAGDTNGVPDIFVRDRAGGAAPEQLLAALRARITDLGLRHGTERSLVAKVDAAAAALRRGDRASACGALGALEHHVRAQAGKHLTALQAMQLLADMRRVRTALACR